MQISSMLYGMLPIRRIDPTIDASDDGCMGCGGPGSGRHATGTKLADPSMHKALMRNGFRPAGTEKDSKHMGTGVRNSNRALYRNQKGHEVTADPKGMFGWRHLAGPSSGFAKGDNAKDFNDFQNKGTTDYAKSRGTY